MISDIFWSSWSSDICGQHCLVSATFETQRSKLRVVLSSKPNSACSVSMLNADVPKSNLWILLATQFWCWPGFYCLGRWRRVTCGEEGVISDQCFWLMLLTDLMESNSQCFFSVESTFQPKPFQNTNIDAGKTHSSCLQVFKCSADADADDAPILRCFGVGPHENCWPSLVMGQSYLAATPVHIVGMRTFYLTATRWKLKVGSFCMRL